MTVSAPSIFNDVLGPVMRGPSSSHSAAALRIGRLTRDLMGGRLRRVVVDYDPSGSLVTTHRDQGSDLGLTGGLLGWEADDDRLERYVEEGEAAGLEIEIRYLDYGAEHPNTYRLAASNERETRCLTAISTGGGMLEVREIDGTAVRLGGDLYEMFVWGEIPSGLNLDGLRRSHDLVAAATLPAEKGLLHLRSRAPFSPELEKLFDANEVRILGPVLPVLAQPGGELPFRGAAEFLEVSGTDPVPLWQWAVRYEAARSGWSEAAVLDRGLEILGTMKHSVERGLEGKEVESRLLPSQVGGLVRSAARHELVPGAVHDRLLLNVTAIMEAKSGMEVIVAAPTAGSCGTLPAALLAVGETTGKSDEEMVRALLTAGLVGLFIAEGATFSAEIGGCMAECGSASGMAAAGIAEMMGAPPTVALGAASMALQNMFGLTCDPIANRVEAPCLGKNAMAGGNAINCVNMSLAGYQHLIPIDEVIVAMNEVAGALPRELCCTSLGGLSVTPTSKALEARLAGKPGC